MDNFLSIKDIKGIDYYMLGGVKRAGKTAFGFNGTLENIKFFNSALDEETVKKDDNKRCYWTFNLYG